jgi:hypothetical protein
VAKGIELDWVLIRVVTVKKIAALAATGVVATALVAFAYWRMNPPPDVAARRAIEAAEAARQQVLEQPVPDVWEDELTQAEDQLEAARTAYTDENFNEALRQAENASARFHALLGIGNKIAGVGQIFTLEGRVTVQRAGKAEWAQAQPRMPVFNGDFVRTGRDGSAEILFVDGTLYRMAPNSLLEIHRRREEEDASPKLVSGTIDINTSESSSTVTTDSTETTIEKDSHVEVGIDNEDKRTKVGVVDGGARVRGGAGEEVVLRGHEQVAATADGKLGDKRRRPPPPWPLDPPNNAGFEMEQEPIIELRWRKASQTAAVHLQVSQSKRFLDGHRDVDKGGLRKDQARLKAVRPGTYYWRLASVEDEDLRSEWSPVQRFQVFSETSGALLEDRTPPVLNVKKPQQLGHLFIVEGSTEVGATVTINDEMVELAADGTFRKTVEAIRSGHSELVIVATDPSGNRTEKREPVYVEVY